MRQPSVWSCLHCGAAYSVEQPTVWSYLHCGVTYAAYNVVLGLQSFCLSWLYTSMAGGRLGRVTSLVSCVNHETLHENNFIFG